MSEGNKTIMGIGKKRITLLLVTHLDQSGRWTGFAREVQKYFFPLTMNIRLHVLLIFNTIYAIQSFEAKHKTEIAICTKLFEGQPVKFSCLEGNSNYCCGSRLEQRCCTVDEVCHKQSRSNL